MPYVQYEIGGLYCLALKGACSRGVQAGCERGLSPKSRFMRDGQSAGYYSVSELACSSGVLIALIVCGVF